jgi:ABC-2 type transport system ATP-binding protein
MQEVKAICSRVIIIGNGKILANAKPDEISSSFQNEMETLHVEFNKEPDYTLLSEIEGIVKVARLKKNEVLIGYKKSVDSRSSVFNYAVKNGLTVLSMQKKEKSLEEVFGELTKE